MVDVSSAVLEQVSERLGLYVYILVDPRDSRPFYVGKGRGVRMAAHGVEAMEAEERTDRAKLARIRDIRAAGREHEIWIARYGMSSAEYTAVEAALIDTLASFPITPAPAESSYRPLELRGELTNARREDAAGKGMVLLERLVDELAAPELTTAVPLLLIALKPWGYLDEEIAGGRTRPGYGFKREWVEPTLRDRDAHLLEMATASWWVITPDQVRRRGITHVVPLYRGVTRGLCAIDDASWERSGARRWGFVASPVLAGDLFDAVVGAHGHRVPGRAHGSQNPVLYWPR
ncbi:MAG: LEM-3-like GIY-YIG domain-containing protein [Acidimicrobiales bacterium]